MANLKLISPWRNYYHEIQAFFKEDPYVTVVFDEDNMEIKLFVQASDKAEALTQILNPEKTFGETTVKVTVIPANTATRDLKLMMKSMIDAEEFERVINIALDCNRLFNDIRVIKGLLGFNAIYVLFNKTVIQYYNDNIGDLNGVKSTLAEDIARDIFVQHPGIFYCTNVSDWVSEEDDERAGRRYVPYSNIRPVCSNYNRN